MPTPSYPQSHDASLSPPRTPHRRRPGLHHFPHDNTPLLDASMINLAKVTDTAVVETTSRECRAFRFEMVALTFARGRPHLAVENLEQRRLVDLGSRHQPAVVGHSQHRRRRDVDAVGLLFLDAPRGIVLLV